MANELKKSNAVERSKHPQGEGFADWFRDVLFASNSALMRDVLRNQKEKLWDEWKKVKPMIELP